MGLRAGKWLARDSEGRLCRGNAAVVVLLVAGACSGIESWSSPAESGGGRSWVRRATVMCADGVTDCADTDPCTVDSCVFNPDPVNCCCDDPSCPGDCLSYTCPCGDSYTCSHTPIDPCDVVDAGTADAPPDGIDSALDDAAGAVDGSKPAVDAAGPALDAAGQDGPAWLDAAGGLDGAGNALDATDLYGCGCRTGGGTTAGGQAVLAFLAIGIVLSCRRRHAGRCRRHGSTWPLAVSVALLVAAAAPPAGAKPARDKAEVAARQHYQRAITYYDLAEFDKAIAEFKQAYVLSNAPGLLFNIAQSYRLKKDHEQALYFYKAYLRRDLTASNRSDVEARIEELTRLIEQGEQNRKAPPQGTIGPGTEQPDAGQEVTSGVGPSPGGELNMPGTGARGGSGGSGGSGDGMSSDAAAIMTVRAPSRLAGLLRADVAPGAGGAVFLVGGRIALSRHFQVMAGGTWGSHFGAWVGAMTILGHGRIRPLLQIGAPLFVAEGFQAGAQVSAGAQWDPHARLGVRLEAGGVYVPTVPGDKKALFVSGLAIEVRP